MNRGGSIDRRPPPPTRTETPRDDARELRRKLRSIADDVAKVRAERDAIARRLATKEQELDDARGALSRFALCAKELAKYHDDAEVQIHVKSGLGDTTLHVHVRNFRNAEREYKRGGDR